MENVGSNSLSVGSRDRMLRGGSWVFDARYARVSFRFDLGDPTNLYNVIGFRLQRAAE